jgi:hypothetical protein
VTVPAADEAQAAQPIQPAHNVTFDRLDPYRVDNPGTGNYNQLYIVDLIYCNNSRWVRINKGRTWY